MSELIQRGSLPTLEQLDDAGKVVVVNSQGTNYILATIPTGGSPMPLNSETDSVTASLDEASLAALETITVNQGASPWVFNTPDTPEGWAITHAPISGARATISKAAEVGVRHVATAVAFNVITTTTAPTTATLTVTLRDGASGAGTPLMTWRVRVSAAMTDTNVSQTLLTGLNIFGSDNTAMTLEFDAGDINTLEDVSLTGYSIEG